MEEEGQRRGRVARLVLVVQFMVKVQGMADVTVLLCRGSCRGWTG